MNSDVLLRKKVLAAVESCSFHASFRSSAFLGFD